jgi:hypothetical protein
MAELSERTTETVSTVLGIVVLACPIDLPEN